MTLIVPQEFDAPKSFQEVGHLVRVEASHLVVGYNFNLRTNELHRDKIANPSAGEEHHFVAYRLKIQSPKAVSMLVRSPSNKNEADEDEV